jgi:thiol-disulfide isomerase/thioredoxin
MASRLKTWLILIILIIAIPALGGIALNCSFSGPSDSTPQPQNATDFTLPTLTGGNITLVELEGTPVVLNFWSTSCYWCRKQLPYLESVAQQSGEEIKVIAINIGESASRIQSSLQSIFSYEPTMTIALDSNGKSFVDYCLAYNNTRGAIPFTLFVDSEGIVKEVKIGAFASETELWNSLHDVFGITIP